MSVDAQLGRTTVDIDMLLAPLRRSLAQARGLVDGEMSKAGDSGGRSLGSRIAKGLGSGLATVAKTTAAVGAAGVVALGSVAFAGAKAGLETASAMEQARVSFTTMLGSAKKADTFLGQLGAFAAKTPFEFPELQTAASSLVSAGVKANKVIPIMTSLGNATAGMGTGSEGIKRATVALQQMQAAGKITGEDLNQLRDAGVPVFDLLSKATGKSVKQVAELASKGKLGAKELRQLMSALESGKGLERFNGLMAAQSNTLTGQLSTLRDTISMGLARAVEPWMPAIKKGLAEVSAAAGPFFDWLAAKSAQLAADAPAMLDKVQAAVARVKEVLSGAGGGGETAEQWAQVRTAASQLGAALPQLLQSLPSVADTMSVASTVMGFAADNIDTLAKILPALAVGFAAVKVAQAAGNVAMAVAIPLRVVELVQTRQLAASNRALTAALTQSAVAQRATTAAETTSVLTRARAGVVTVAKTVAEKAAAIASKSYAAAQWLVNAALTANPIGLVILALVALGAAIFLAWKKSETFRAIVLGAWAGIQKGVSAAIGWLKVAVPAVFAWIKTAFLRYTPLGIIISHWGQIRAGIATAVGHVKATIGWFAGLPGRFGSWFAAAHRAAVGKLLDLVGWVKGLPGRILSGLGNIGGTLFRKGADLIQGLIDGVMSKIRAVTDAAGKVAQKIKDFFPGSPVKEGPLTSWNNGGAGKRLGGSLVRGMLSEVSAVRAASVALAAAAVTPMALAPAGVALAAGSVGISPSRSTSVVAPAGEVDAAGRGVNVNVYPREQQSELAIAHGVARTIGRRIRQ